MDKQGKGNGGIIIVLILLIVGAFYFFPNEIKGIWEDLKNTEESKNITLINDYDNYTIRGKPTKTIEFECQSESDCRIYIPNCGNCTCLEGNCYEGI